MMFRIRCEVVNHVTKSSDYDWVDLPVSSVIAMATTLEETAVAEPADDPAVGLLTPPFYFVYKNPSAHVKIGMKQNAKLH